MKKISKLVNLGLGYVLIAISLIGAFGAISFQFGLDLMEREGYLFGHDDSASNTPIFYGLMSIAGALLILKPNNEGEK